MEKKGYATCTRKGLYNFWNGGAHTNSMMIKPQIRASHSDWSLSWHIRIIIIIIIIENSRQKGGLGWVQLTYLHNPTENLKIEKRHWRRSRWCLSHKQPSKRKTTQKKTNQVEPLFTLSSFLIFEEYIYINFSHIHVYT